MACSAADNEQQQHAPTSLMISYQFRWAVEMRPSRHCCMTKGASRTSLMTDSRHAHRNTGEVDGDELLGIQGAMPVLTGGNRRRQNHTRSVGSLPDVFQVHSPCDLLFAQPGSPIVNQSVLAGSLSESAVLQHQAGLHQYVTRQLSAWHLTAQHATCYFPAADVIMCKDCARAQQAASDLQVL